MINFSVFCRQVETYASVPLGAIFSRTIDRHRLSPDGFAAMADLALFRKGWPPPKISRKLNPSVVFLANHDVETFIDSYLHVLRPKVLIVGDGDRDWRFFDFPELSFVKRVFLQNSFIPNDSRFRCLPIGIENRKYGRNGMPYNFVKFYSSRKKSSGIFLGPLGKTHPVRKNLSELDLSHIENLQRLEERISSIEFAYRSSHWSHVLAPRGNGKDTHRFWEALYRGSIPVVTDDEWSKNIASYGIPIETVSEWTTREIERIAASPRFRPRPPLTIPALWKRFWTDQIKEVC